MKRKLCLALETTGLHLGAALWEFGDGEPRAKKKVIESGSSRHTDRVIPVIDRLLRAAKVKAEDLSAIAVDVGPGSFTGVRVGVATARALAQGLHLPLVGISSLEAMAWASERRHDGIRVSVLPALSGEVYFAVYRMTAGRLSVVRSPAWVDEKTFEAHKSRLKPGAVIVNEPPHVNAIAERACLRLAKEPASRFAFEKAVPVYLQPSWAERARLTGK